MKKLFSLAMIVAVAFVVVGCQKSDEQKAKEAVGGAVSAATNAVAK